MGSSRRAARLHGSSDLVTITACGRRETSFEKLAREKEKTNCSFAQLSSSSKCPLVRPSWSFCFNKTRTYRGYRETAGGSLLRSNYALILSHLPKDFERKF